MDEVVSVAPMMEWTDRHYRYLMRGISKHTTLYTEMVVDTTVLHQSSNLDFFIGQNIHEDPSVIQIGGHDPESVARASEICGQYGNYNEINLNCGCPSPRVSRRSFGARLMLEPELVREIVSRMQRVVNIPVTVKCRIGVDSVDSYQELCHFIQTVSSAGVKKFVVHARKCILKGLTPKQNRDIPPLRHEIVHQLVKDFPELKFILNGGLQSLRDVKSHLVYNEENDYLPVTGGMIGRAAYNDPFILAKADSTFFGVPDPCLTRRQVVDRYLDYCDFVQSEEGPTRIVNGKVQKIATSFLLKPLQNAFVGCQGVNRYRIAANDIYVEKARAPNHSSINPTPREVIEEAMLQIRGSDLDAPIGNPYPLSSLHESSIKTYGAVVVLSPYSIRTRNSLENTPSHANHSNVNIIDNINNSSRSINSILEYRDTEVSSTLNSHTRCSNSISNSLYEHNRIWSEASIDNNEFITTTNIEYSTGKNVIANKIMAYNSIATTSSNMDDLVSKRDLNVFITSHFNEFYVALSYCQYFDDKPTRF